MDSSIQPIRIMVTGGAGFVGAATVRHLLQTSSVRVLNLDKLTYAADRASAESFQGNSNYQFVEADICDRDAVQAALESFQPDAIIHAAAETHVDRSIVNPTDFIKTNLVGTYTLLEAVHDYWSSLTEDRQRDFRFLHVSTDEVFGSLGDEGLFFEDSAYRPRSPYSASKAGSDHLVMAWHHTFGLPVLLTHCSNNYGPYQFPEKLIPRMILQAIAEQPLPLYGNGENIRDWLFVSDHAKALCLVLAQGQIGQTYNIGGNNERTNLEVVQAVCSLLDELRPRTSGTHSELIEFVADRPGHDWRYAIDASKIQRELGWNAEENFESGLEKTVRWYLANTSWWKA